MNDFFRFGLALLCKQRLDLSDILLNRRQCCLLRRGFQLNGTVRGTMRGTVHGSPRSGKTQCQFFDLIAFQAVLPAQQ